MADDRDHPADPVRVFISYRRADTFLSASWLHEKLVATFGHKNVFMDRSSIPDGAEFQQFIDAGLGRADALIAVIGPQWLSCGRLNDWEDPVRRELEIALTRGIPVFPVLVAGAQMPGKAQLPSELRGLGDRQASELPHAEFSKRAKELADSVRERVDEQRRGSTAVDRPGTQFKSYLLERPLKSDRPTQLYQGYDTMRSQSVAIVVLGPPLSKDADVKKRFLHEAETVAAMRDPHVMRVADYGVDEDRLFAATPLSGDELLLDRLVRDRRLAPATAVAVVEGVAAATDALHAHAIVGLDVRPASVHLKLDAAGVLTPDVHASLFAFGASRFAAEPPSPGWVAYAAPERLRAEPPDGRADVYALACVLYECLTGRQPYPGGTEAHVTTRHLEAAIPRPTDHCLSIDGRMDRVIRTGMAKDPADRYTTAGELAAAARSAITPGSMRRLRTVVTILSRRVLGRMPPTVMWPWHPAALDRWPTLVLCVAAALGPLAALACWLAGGLWLAATTDRASGDPLDFSAPHLVLGLIGFPLSVAIATGTAALLAFLLTVATHRLWSPGSRPDPEEARRTGETVAILAALLVATCAGVFTPVARLAWMLDRHQVTIADGNYTVGAAAVVIAVLTGGLSIGSALALASRASTSVDGHLSR